MLNLVPADMDPGRHHHHHGGGGTRYVHVHSKPRT
jgi:hypothetical protein